MKKQELRIVHGGLNKRKSKKNETFTDMKLTKLNLKASTKYINSNINLYPL